MHFLGCVVGVVLITAAAAEDTRHTIRLLSALGILHKPLISCHEHNINSSVQQLIGRLEAGDSVAIVSDAGSSSLSHRPFIGHAIWHTVCLNS